MLEWLFYFLFGGMGPACDANSVSDLAQCTNSGMVSVQGGGGGADPVDPDEKDKN
jgi:hypothetical protein